MIDNIQNTFISMLEESPWMDTISKARAVDKVRGIHFSNSLSIKQTTLKYRPELSRKKLAIPTI